MVTKHEQILLYIQQLSVGDKISVRQIAKALKVSEGTAYRAIKEAEHRGYVSTIERVGTVRIDFKEKSNIAHVTYAEIVSITDGHVLGGSNGLHKKLNKFVIGAMELDAMMTYTEAGSLLIVGNRESAQALALQEGAAILITGGFKASESIIQLANQLALPVISTSYDSFTVAALIHRAIDNQQIKQDILLVEDVYTDLSNSVFMYIDEKVQDWLNKERKTGHSRFPVVNRQFKVVGMVTSKDVIEESSVTNIDKVMTKHPLTVHLKTSVAAVAQRMIWDSIEVLPVVSHDDKLLGVISRQDVLKALRFNKRQAQVGETIDDIICQSLEKIVKDDTESFLFDVTPQMVNSLGTISYGVLTSLVSESCIQILRNFRKSNIVMENIALYFVRPIAFDQKVSLTPNILDIGRRSAKVDVEIHVQHTLVAKAIVTCQFLY